MTQRILLLAIFSVLLTGCATRSISDSGNSRHSYYGSYGSTNPLYRGELSEFAVLGIEAGREYSEAEIRAAAEAGKEDLTLRRGDSILLIQSGALIPDDEMIGLLSQYFRVTPFTGVPEKNDTENASYSSGLRLAAAKAGISKILVYWGVLESGITNLGSKTVSWVPIVGSVIPDETQNVRIRLKVGIIDVPTGAWDLFAAESFQDSAMSTRLNRADSDQEQVALLKANAYESATKAVIARYER